MHLHIITFDIPYPSTYGRGIDVFYKIKALAEEGLKIHLHCFEYGRTHSKELETICEEIYYYPRKKILASLPLKIPHAVNSRRSRELLQNLQADDYPILFEGLHSCFYLAHKSLAHRKKLVRMHNVEWEYYYELAQRETRVTQQAYLLLESRRLQSFETVLGHSDHILTISPKDLEYYQQMFRQSSYLPAFHPHRGMNSLSGRGDYCLYHAKLNIAENHEVAMFLIQEVFADLSVPLIIAGSEPLPKLITKISEFNHINLRHNPGRGEMLDLIRQAHIHVLPTFQSTGIKLKLLSALFSGRFVLVNEPMVSKTGLEEYCTIAHDAGEFKRLIIQLMKHDFSQHEIDKRKELLKRTFSNKHNAQHIIKQLARY